MPPLERSPSRNPSGLEKTMEHPDGSRLLEALNRMLAQEHACAIRYATHAALVTGPSVDPVSARFREIASDEIAHAGKLRERICALGGTPTQEVAGGDPGAASTLADMIELNILEERGAIVEYAKILEGIPRLDVLLCRTLEDILKDEQEHLEELIALTPAKEDNVSTRQIRIHRHSRAAVMARQAGDGAPAESRD